MSIKVRYFASLKEQVGRSDDELEVEDILCIRDLWDRLNPEVALPEKVLVAVNMDYAALDTAVKEGDEVAFFPPVTGG